MKTFNYYKKLIEDDCEEIRLTAFYIVSFLDFSSTSNLVESLHKERTWIKKEGYTEEEVSATITYNNIEFAMNYSPNKDELLFSFKEDLKRQVSFNSKNQLLNYMSSHNGRIDFMGKPRVYCLELKNDLYDFIFSEYHLFDHVIIYNPSIDIDNTVRAHCFLFDYRLNVGIDLKGTFKNNDIRMKQLNLFNINKIDRNKIEKNNTQLLWHDFSSSAIDIQYFFENIFTINLLNSDIYNTIEKEGFRSLHNENLRDLIELNILI